MLSELARQNSDLSRAYRLQVKGVLNSPIVDLCADVTIVQQECDGILMLSLIADLAVLRNLLDQFDEFNLTLLPSEYETQTTDPLKNEPLDISQWICTDLTRSE